MNDPIDWEQLARDLGIEDEGASTYLAQEAIERLLGEERIKATVDYIVDFRPGCELARLTLKILTPWSAMQRCREIYLSDPDQERKVQAISLLVDAADTRALPWVAGFLADDDPSIQNCGAGILDQLLWCGLVDVEECEALIQAVHSHANENVRRIGAFIEQYLTAREQRGPKPSRENPE